MSKPRVLYYIWDDILKYAPALDIGECEIASSGETDQEILDQLKAYYDRHMPVPLIQWMRVNKPDPNLIYAKEFEKQDNFINSFILRMLYPSFKDAEYNPVMVIGTHISKSVKLPVYQIKTPVATFTLRNNFYDWKVSVVSIFSLDINFMRLFNEYKRVGAQYCEGFPFTQIFSSYSTCHKRFTCEIANDYDLYTFFFLIRNYLRGLKPLYTENTELREYIASI